MAMANMNLIGVFVTKLWPEQVLACGGGGTKNIIPPKFSNFGDIIRYGYRLSISMNVPASEPFNSWSTHFVQGFFGMRFHTLPVKKLGPTGFFGHFEK